MAVTGDVLAGRLRSAISDAGLTPQSIADAVGLDPQALSRALAGARDFKSLELALLAQHLGLTVRSLLVESPQQEGGLMSVVRRWRTSGGPGAF